MELVSTGIILGLVQVAKTLGLPKKFIPLFSVILGVLFGILGYVSLNQDLVGCILAGIVYGLSAVGLWSGSKNTVEAFKKDFTKENLTKEISG